MLLSFVFGFVFVLRWRALESEDEANEWRIFKGSESELCRWCLVDNGVKGTVTVAALLPAPASVVRRRMRREERQMREKGQAAIGIFLFVFVLGSLAGCDSIHRSA